MKKTLFIIEAAHDYAKTSFYLQDVLCTELYLYPLEIAATSHLDVTFKTGHVKSLPCVNRWQQDLVDIHIRLEQALRDLDYHYD